MVHVPYKGMGAILVELLGGQIQVSFSTVIGVLPQVRAQKLRALAVTGAQRAQAAPDLPTMMEAGVAGFSVTQWHGLLAPAGTSSAVVERLNRETVKAVRLPEIAARLASDGTEAIGSSSHKFAEHLAAERNKWARVIAGAGIRAE